jgi:hypothetical protein
VAKEGYRSTGLDFDSELFLLEVLECEEHDYGAREEKRRLKDKAL